MKSRSASPLRGRIEQQLATGPMTVRQIAALMPDLTELQINQALVKLASLDRVHRTSEKGKYPVVYARGGAPAIPPGMAQPTRISKMEGAYTCPELRRNPGIPDERFEAFRLPSVINGRRVERTAP